MGLGDVLEFSHSAFVSPHVSVMCWRQMVKQAASVMDSSPPNTVRQFLTKIFVKNCLTVFAIDNFPIVSKIILATIGKFTSKL